MDGVRPRQGAGVGQDRPCAVRKPSGLDQDHRFEPRCRAGGGQELARRAQGFDKEQDGAGVTVEGQMIEDVAKIQVNHVAQGDQVRKANAPRQGPVQHRGDQGSGLGDEGDPSGWRRSVGQAGVE